MEQNSETWLTRGIPLYSSHSMLSIKKQNDRDLNRSLLFTAPTKLMPFMRRRSNPHQRSTFVISWRGVDWPTLFEAIRNCPVGGPRAILLCILYILGLRPFACSLTFHTNDIADWFASLHSVQCRICSLSPRSDANCRNNRRNCRRLENIQYGKTIGVDDKLAWIESVRQNHKYFRELTGHARSTMRRSESRQNYGGRYLLYI